MSKILIRLIFICTISFLSVVFCVSCQEKETYWAIDSIYKENKEPLRGINYGIMLAMIRQDTHLKKNGNILTIDFPDEKIVNTDTLFSLNNERFPDDFFIEEYKGILKDSLYFIGIEKGKFKMKFINSNTGDDDKRTVIEFRKMSESEYLTSLEEAKNRRKEQDRLIGELLAVVKKDSLWSTKPLEAVNKTFMIFDKTFVVKCHKDYEMDYSRSLYSHSFDKLKVGAGSSSDKDQYLDLFEITGSSNFHAPKIIFSLDSKDKFDFDRYTQEYPSENMVYKDNNSFVLADVGYDHDEEKAVFERITLFKYFYVQDTHVIFSNQLFVNNDNLLLAKTQLGLMQSFSVK